MTQPPSIVIIGMGYIMEYLLPSYTAILGGGQHLRSHVLATTLDSRGLEAKRARLGFEVQLGDNPGALARMDPDIILFAPPPDAVPQITREELAPHYEACRRRGRALPELYAFPPSPEPGWYTQWLGEDAPVAVCIPKTESGIPGEELTMLTFGTARPWEGARLARLMAFAAPMGGAEILSASEFYSQLGCRCVTNSLNETFFTAADCLREKGLDISHSAMAGYVKTLLPPMAGSLPAPQGQAPLPPALADALERITGILLRSVSDYMVGQGFDQPRALRRMQARVHGHLDLCLTQSRLDITRQIKCYATKGGISEISLLDYGVLLEKGMEALFGAWPQTAVDAAFEAWLAGQYRIMCDHATHRAATLHEDLPLPDFDSRHMDRMMAYIRKTTRQFAGARAADVVLGAMAAWLDGCPDELGWAYKLCGVYHAADRWLQGNLPGDTAGDIISEARLAFGRRYGQGAAYLPIQLEALFARETEGQ